LDTGPQVSGVSSEKARASLKPDTRHLKPVLREGFTTPDNVQKKDLFFNHVTRSVFMIFFPFLMGAVFYFFVWRFSLTTTGHFSKF